MICRNCNKLLSDNINICPFCKCSVNDNTVNINNDVVREFYNKGTTKAMESRNNRVSARKNSLIGVFIFVAIIVIILVLFYFFR